MEINKTDILTILILSTVFFSIATWNLGSSQVPINNWETTDNADFFVDIGRIEDVGFVYFLVKSQPSNDIKINVSIYSGFPGNWDFSETVNIGSSYYSWTNGNINTDSQYLRFVVQNGFIEISELAILKLILAYLMRDIRYIISKITYHRDY